MAIGDPADGYFASQLIRETGGWSEDVYDDDIVEAMTLLAETEGIWAETAGGVTLAVARKLIEQGKIGSETFKEAGTYPYFCEIHPDMRGTVEVVEK